MRLGRNQSSSGAFHFKSVPSFEGPPLGGPPSPTGMTSPRAFRNSARQQTSSSGNHQILPVDNNDTISTDSDAEYSTCTWIPWFCTLYGHEILAEVDEEFIRDAFNLFGLKARVSRYEEAISVMMGPAPTPDDLKKANFRELHAQTAHLYGLIHARYILTPKGLMRMRQKYINGVFGRCPRVMCDQPCVLPIGLTDEMRQHRVRVYCPMCQEAYVPRSSGSSVDRPMERQRSISSVADDEDEDTDAPRIAGNVDGAFFGPNFPQVFLLQFTGLIPKMPPIPYFPRIFGFKIRGARSIIQTKIDKGEYGKDFALNIQSGKDSLRGNGVKNKHLEGAREQQTGGA